MLPASQLPACKYNVRDVGFVDWNPAPYQLMVFVDKNAEAGWLTKIRNTAAATFLEANVELAVQESPAPTLLEKYSVAKLPALVLVGSDQRALPIPLGSGPDSPQAAVWDALEGVVASPQREALLNRIVEAYAVVLVTEGPNADENARARQAAASAVERVGRLMDRLPKAVKNPPEVMVIDRATAAKERVLLWSLGIEDTNETGVAVLSGRARRVGPLLQGGLVTETAIYRALAVLGQDCECDLDRTWMTGPMVPAQWGREQQEAVQRLSGFDAESPLIKAEIGRIVARGPSSTARTVGLPSAKGGLDFDALGYSEVSVDELTTPSQAQGEGANEAEAAEPAPPKNGAIQAVASQPRVHIEWHVSLSWMTWTVLALVFVGLGGGVLLLWRGRRND